MNKNRRKQLKEWVKKAEQLKCELEQIQSDEEEAFDNMSEGLQSATVGMNSEEAIDKLIEKLPEKYREMAKGEGGFYAVLQSLFVPYGEVPVVEEAQGLTRC